VSWRLWLAVNSLPQGYPIGYRAARPCTPEDYATTPKTLIFPCDDELNPPFATPYQIGGRGARPCAPEDHSTKPKTLILPCAILYPLSGDLNLSILIVDNPGMFFNLLLSRWKNLPNYSSNQRAIFGVQPRLSVNAYNQIRFILSKHYGCPRNQKRNRNVV